MSPPSRSSPRLQSCVRVALILLLSPTVAVQPFEVGKNLPMGPDGKANALWSPYTSQFNLSRHPAASVPCGLSREGLPIGLQWRRPISAGNLPRDALNAIRQT